VPVYINKSSSLFLSFSIPPSLICTKALRD
jgi:hypothetical protein